MSDADWLQERIEHYQAWANNMWKAIKDLEDMDMLGRNLRRLIL